MNTPKYAYLLLGFLFTYWLIPSIQASEPSQTLAALQQDMLQQFAQTRHDDRLKQRPNRLDANRHEHDVTVQTMAKQRLPEFIQPGKGAQINLYTEFGSKSKCLD